MKPSEIFRENAENCARLAEAESTADGPAYKRYKRMEAAWRALAEEQEWLDGEVPPASRERFIKRVNAAGDAVSHQAVDGRMAPNE
jgi:hypothetical protein